MNWVWTLARSRWTEYKKWAHVALRIPWNSFPQTLLFGSFQYLQVSEESREQVVAQVHPHAQAASTHDSPLTAAPLNATTLELIRPSRSA